MPTQVVAYQTLNELNNNDRVKKIIHFLLTFNLRTIRNWRNREK